MASSALASACYASSRTVSLASEEASSRKFASVSKMNEHDRMSVGRTIHAWEKFANALLTKYEKEREEKGPSELLTRDIILIENYQNVLCMLEWEYSAMGALEESSNQFLIAKDEAYEIGALAEYQRISDKDESHLYLGELITAPWNLRLEAQKTALPPPLRGGGILLIHALFNIAKKIDCKKLCVTSTPVSLDFYAKLGMTKKGIHRFEFDISSSDDEEKINNALQRAFGESFHYSFLR